MQFTKIPNYVLIILLGLVSFSIYANSLKGEFLVDDETGILINSKVHDYKSYFSKQFKIAPGMLDELERVFIWHIWDRNPYPYHLFNVIVHTSCVILLFILINILFNNRALSFLSSFIFAIHPIHTEAVSWISGGPYVFSSLFFISALIFYILSDKSIFYLALAVIFFSLCFFTGNTVVTLPIIFILYELFFNGYRKVYNHKKSRIEVIAEGDFLDRSENKRLRRIRLLVLFLMLIVAALFIGKAFVGRSRCIHTIFYFKGARYLVVIAKAFVYYLKILYLPLQRGLYHSFGYDALNIQKISPAFFTALIVIASLIFIFFRCRKNALAVSFGIGWFFITYLPYSNIIPVCNIISERYMYLPSVGFSIVIAYLILKTWKIINQPLSAPALKSGVCPRVIPKAAYTYPALWAGFERRRTYQGAQYRKILRYIAIIAITFFLGSYSLLTLKHNIQYSNIITYWQTNINNFPYGYKAYNNLAGTYYALGNRQQAITYCWVNLMIKPDQPHVWCNLGKVYRETGELEWAKYCYEEALKVDKGFLPAVSGLEAVKKELLKKEKSGNVKKLR